MAFLSSSRKQTVDWEKSSATTMADNPFGRNASGLSTKAEANSPSALLEHRANDQKLAGRNVRLVLAILDDSKFSDSRCSPGMSMLPFLPSQGRIALGLVLLTLIVDSLFYWNLPAPCPF